MSNKIRPEGQDVFSFLGDGKDYSKGLTKGTKLTDLDGESAPKYLGSGVPINSIGRIVHGIIDTNSIDQKSLEEVNHKGLLSKLECGRIASTITNLGSKIAEIFYNEVGEKDKEYNTAQFNLGLIYLEKAQSKIYKFLNKTPVEKLPKQITGSLIKDLGDCLTDKKLILEIKELLEIAKNCFENALVDQEENSPIIFKIAESILQLAELQGEQNKKLQLTQEAIELLNTLKEGPYGEYTENLLAHYS